MEIVLERLNGCLSVWVRRFLTRSGAQRFTWLLGYRLAVDRIREGDVADAEHEQHRKRGADIGEDECVDGRRDVVAADRDRAAVISFFVNRTCPERSASCGRALRARDGATARGATY